MHPQTLRVYERKGLLDPSRTEGGSRRFSEQDLDRLRHIQSLTNAGLNLEGVRRVLELEAEVARLRQPSSTATRAEAREAVAVTHRQYRRELVPLSPDARARPGRPDGRPTARRWRIPMSHQPRPLDAQDPGGVPAAVERARAAHNAEVTPEHLLAAILDQPEGIAGPILDPGRRGARRGPRPDRRRARPGCPRPSAARSRPSSRALRDVLDRGRHPARRHGRRVPLGRAPDAGHGRPHRRGPRRSC